MTLALLTRQIGHYHHARFSAVTSQRADFHVISLANEGKFGGFVSQETKTYPVHRLYPDMETYMKAGRQIWADLEPVLNQIAPSVIAVPGWASPECFAAMNWAARNRARIIIMSDSQIGDAERSAVREYIKRRMLKYGHAALVAGRPHKSYMETLGFSAERIFFGYDVVDNDHFMTGADLARSKGLKPEGFPDRYLLASSRFIAKKNLPALIHAYALAKAQIPSVPDLVILGDGEDRPLLEEAIDTLNLQGHIHLAGFHDYAQLPAIYGQAEAFVHVPKTEQWGLVVNEAAASGLPLVLSSTCGASSELLVTGQNGFSCDPLEVQSIADALIKLFSRDNAERQAFGLRSRDIVSEWGPERFANGLEKACQAALGQKLQQISAVDRTLMKFLSRRPAETVK